LTFVIHVLKQLLARQILNAANDIRQVRILERNVVLLPALAFELES
jgi:hypothetical protein